MDCRRPGSSVHGILQAKILKQVAISFSRGSSWHRDWTRLLHCGQMLYHWATTGIRASLRSLLKASGAEAARTQVSWTPGSTVHGSTSVLNLFFNQDISNFAFFSSTCKSVHVYTILTHTHNWEILNRDYIGRRLNNSLGMYLCIIIIFKQ